MDGMSTARTNGDAASARHGATPPSGDAGVQRLLSLLTRQQFLIHQLGALATKQSTLVQDGQAQPLLEVLRQRQELIDRVLAAQAEVGPLAAALQNEAMTADDRARAMELIETIKAELNRVVNQDDADRHALREASESSLPAVTVTDRGKQAQQAYSQTTTLL